MFSRNVTCSVARLYLQDGVTSTWQTASGFPRNLLQSIQTSLQGLDVQRKFIADGQGGGAYIFYSATQDLYNRTHRNVIAVHVPAGGSYDASFGATLERRVQHLFASTAEVRPSELTFVTSQPYAFPQVRTLAMAAAIAALILSVVVWMLPSGQTSNDPHWGPTLQDISVALSRTVSSPKEVLNAIRNPGGVVQRADFLKIVGGHYPEYDKCLPHTEAKECATPREVLETFSDAKAKEWLWKCVDETIGIERCLGAKVERDAKKQGENYLSAVKVIALANSLCKFGKSNSSASHSDKLYAINSELIESYKKLGDLAARVNGRGLGVDRYNDGAKLVASAQRGNQTLAEFDAKFTEKECVEWAHPQK